MLLNVTINSTPFFCVELFMLCHKECLRNYNVFITKGSRPFIYVHNIKASSSKSGPERMLQYKYTK